MRFALSAAAFALSIATSRALLRSGMGSMAIRRGKVSPSARSMSSTSGDGPAAVNNMSVTELAAILKGDLRDNYQVSKKWNDLCSNNPGNYCDTKASAKV